MPVPKYDNEAQQLRSLASADGVTIACSPHADDEMRKDHQTRPDILTILRACSVVNIELVNSEWRWTAEGTNADSEVVNVVVVVDEPNLRIDVITVWKV